MGIHMVNEKKITRPHTTFSQMIVYQKRKKG